MKTELTAERLRQLLHYDPETGVFVRLACKYPQYVGREVGANSKVGYLYISVDGRAYLAHRLAWLYVTGAWPDIHLDHKNGVRTDNRFDNLRESTNAQNMQNLGITKMNKSGRTGVSWDDANKKWRANICVNGKVRNLGRFLVIGDAVAARESAKATLHTFNPVDRMNDGHRSGA